jgi:hypothetical protein
MFTFIILFQRLREVTSHSFHFGGGNPHFIFVHEHLHSLSWIEDLERLCVCMIMMKVGLGIVVSFFCL